MISSETGVSVEEAMPQPDELTRRVLTNRYLFIENAATREQLHRQQPKRRAWLWLLIGSMLLLVALLLFAGCAYQPTTCTRAYTRLTRPNNWLGAPYATEITYTHTSGRDCEVQK